MKDFGITTLITLDEEMGDVGTGALVGSAIGAGSAALGWLRKRSQLKQKMANCQGDPSCIEQTKLELQALNAQALRSGVKRGLGGAAMGAVAGQASGMAKGALGGSYTQLGNIAGKGAQTFTGAGGNVNASMTSNVIPVAATVRSVATDLYKTGQGKSWRDVLSQQGDESLKSRYAVAKQMGRLAGF